MNKELISREQSIFLIFIGLVGVKFLFFNTYLIEAAGRDAWLGVVGGQFLGLSLSLVIIKLARLFPKQTVIQYLPKIIGSFLGKFIGLIYILFILIYIGLVLRLNIELQMMLMPETPPLAFAILLMGVVVYVAKEGFEVYIRTSQLFIPLVLLGLIFISLVALQRGEMASFQPFLEYGIEPVLGASLRMFSLSSAGLLFMGFWLSYLNKLDHLEKITIFSSFLISFIMLIGISLVISVLGVEESLFYTFPVLTISRLLDVGGFLQGFEGILTFVWFPMVFMKVAGLFFTVVVGTSQLFNLKEYKPLVLPLAFIIVGVSLVPDNFELLKLSIERLSIYILFPLLLIFPISYLVARFRGLGEK